jgi:hypothetical protein
MNHGVNSLSKASKISQVVDGATNLGDCKQWRVPSLKSRLESYLIWLIWDRPGAQVLFRRPIHSTKFTFFLLIDSRVISIIEMIPRTSSLWWNPDIARVRSAISQMPIASAVCMFSVNISFYVRSMFKSGDAIWDGSFVWTLSVRSKANGAIVVSYGRVVKYQESENSAARLWSLKKCSRIAPSSRSSSLQKRTLVVFNWSILNSDLPIRAIDTLSSSAARNWDEPELSSGHNQQPLASFK